MNVSGSVTAGYGVSAGEATISPKLTPTTPALMSKPASMQGMKVMILMLISIPILKVH